MNNEIEKMKEFKVIRNAIPDHMCKFIENEFEIIIKAQNYLKNTKELDYAFGDSQIPKSFSVYASSFGESLLLFLQPLIENETGNKILPCYSYARKYYRGAKMEKHKDRPSCEISATLCISLNGEPWPIYFQPDNKEKVKILLNPGDLIIYRGCDVEHWRKKFKQGDSMIQIFVHYVNAEGPYRDFIFDKRPFLGLQK